MEKCSPPKTISIKSSNSELPKVEEFIKDYFEQYNISNRYFNNVWLCISEAVINSIEHGNRNDSNKEVSIFVNCGTGILIAKVNDQGEGFDHNFIEDPTKNENLLKESGRGIHIMKKLSDEIEFDKNEIKIVFKIDCFSE